MEGVTDGNVKDYIHMVHLIVFCVLRDTKEIAWDQAFPRCLHHPGKTHVTLLCSIVGMLTFILSTF